MVIATDRLVVRHPSEGDRSRFVELFTSVEFMAYSDVLDVPRAHARFDHMLRLASNLLYAKQPIVERSSGQIVGYTGADIVSYEGSDRLEWGWRLIAEARGQGLATEAVSALLAFADEIDSGEMLCLINPANERSRSVADKVGFEWSRQLDWMGDPSDPVDVLVRPIGCNGSALERRKRNQG